MDKGNHRKHKRKTNRSDRDGGGEPALFPFEERTDTGGQQGKCRNQPQVANNPDGGGHGQTYRSLHSGLFQSNHVRRRWTGAPGSPKRTWAGNDGAKPFKRFSFFPSIAAEVPAKSIRKEHVR